MIATIRNFLAHVGKDFQVVGGRHASVWRCLLRSALVLLLLGCLVNSPAVWHGRINVPKEAEVVHMPLKEASAYAAQIQTLLSSANDVSCKCNRDENHTILRSVLKEAWVVNRHFPWRDIVQSCQDDSSLNFTQFEICPGRVPKVEDPLVIEALLVTWELLSYNGIECNTMVERALGKTVFLIKLLACFDAAVDRTRDRLLESYLLANKTITPKEYIGSVQAMQLIMGNEFLWGFLESISLKAYDGEHRAVINATHTKLASYSWNGWLAIEYWLMDSGSPVIYPAPIDWNMRYEEVLWQCHPYSCKWVQREDVFEASWRIFEGFGGGIELGSIGIFIILSIIFGHHHETADGDVEDVENGHHGVVLPECLKNSCSRVVDGVRSTWVSTKQGAMALWRFSSSYMTSRPELSSDLHSQGQRLISVITSGNSQRDDDGVL